MTAKAHWLARRMPTREQLERNRWVRPFSGRVLRADLWRFNRRSVPRGLALGLFVGILFPFAHSLIAALTAVFVRGNVPIAIASTWASNPATWVLIFPGAYRIGEWMIHADSLAPLSPVATTMHQTQTDLLLEQLTGKGLDTALGLLVIASIASFAAYFVSAWAWRLWVARKRRARLDAFHRRRVEALDMGGGPSQA